MDRAKLIEEHDDIFSDLASYAIVKNDYRDGKDHFLIFNIQTNAIILIEEYIDDIIQIMIEKGVSIFNSIEAAENKDYNSYSLKWDDEIKDWIKIYHKDL